MAKKTPRFVKARRLRWVFSWWQSCTGPRPEARIREVVSSGLRRIKERFGPCNRAHWGNWQLFHRSPVIPNPSDLYLSAFAQDSSKGRLAGVFGAEPIFAFGTQVLPELMTSSPNGGSSMRSGDLPCLWTDLKAHLSEVMVQRQ